MDELADSSGVLHDPAILRQRLAEAGYLFFRGLLPAGSVRAAGAAVLARLRDHPAPSELVLGPAGHDREVFSRLFHDEPWWEPVPAGLDLRPGQNSPPGPSRFFAVHPGWQAWRPPPSAVH